MAGSTGANGRGATGQAIQEHVEETLPAEGCQDPSGEDVAIGPGSLPANFSSRLPSTAPDRQNYFLGRKTNTQNTAEWRQAFANAFTPEEKLALIKRIYKSAMDGDMKAAALLLHQSLGKPAVTTAGKMADDVVTDAMEKRLALLPPEELETYIKITAKLQESTEVAQ